MGYITVKKANCKNCYKCLKNCVIKSIKIEDEKVNIIHDQCVLCGKCITVCPQTAKKPNYNLLKVMEYIDNKDIKTVVSLAPSYIAAFGDNYKKAVAALKKLGFDYVEETSIGASYVTEKYSELIAQRKTDNIITSCCPTVNMLITKYYPELIPYLAPVITPLMAHSKLIKENYGNDVKVIFVGPCLSKIKECEETDEIDGVLPFNKLFELFKNSNIDLNNLEDTDFDKNSNYSRIYPISGGILSDLNKRGIKSDYKHLNISGLERVVRFFDEIKRGNIHGVFAEVNSCIDGCINGPLMPKGYNNMFMGKLKITEYANASDLDIDKQNVGLDTKFEKEEIINKMPTEEEITEILRQIGKYSKEQELNCGSCGYPTCREKAIAVYQGKAELYMCLPYMTDINQTLSNVTLSVTPNFIIAVDENMLIKEFNVAAQKFFKINRKDALNKPIDAFIDSTDFEYVIKNRTSLYDKKVTYDDFGLITEQQIIYASDRNMAIAIIKDITEDEKQLADTYCRKLETVEMAQKVIDKQMVVAQEIASLLGETTAETKITLNKLKELIVNERANSDGE